MTEQEAINILENEKPHCGETVVYIESEKYEAYCMAISTLKKQIPKKPIHIKDAEIRNTDLYQCPSCDRRFLGKGIATYCYHCGQALDWEMEAEQ